MAKVETSWKCDENWKARYSQLYSFRSSSILSLKEEPRRPRVSFMSHDFGPSSSSVGEGAQSPRLGSFRSIRSRQRSLDKTSRAPSDDLGGHETALLDMVRARYHTTSRETATQPLDLLQDDASDDDLFAESCVHGLSIRNTERSISRSRVSRASTRRDMDIPSILAFTTRTPAPIHLEIPEFQAAKIPQQEALPRWSIRRSVCPVCSQKWRDRSSITNVKYSGLRRNSSQELPSIIAPARLRTSITLQYVPRPALAAVDEEAGVFHGGLRSTGASWQLTRARRFRAPKPHVPPPEATAPPSATAPLARKDLDTRVSRFLSVVEGVPELDVSS